MQGIVAEENEAIDEEFEGGVKDAALISAAQRVEHYEIAAYGTVRTYAEILGDQNAVELLEKTLQEEKEIDEKLTELAQTINAEAAGSESEETAKSDIDPSTTTRKAKSAGM